MNKEQTRPGQDAHPECLRQLPSTSHRANLRLVIAPDMDDDDGLPMLLLLRTTVIKPAEPVELMRFLKDDQVSRYIEQRWLILQEKVLSSKVSFHD